MYVCDVKSCKICIYDGSLIGVDACPLGDICIDTYLHCVTIIALHPSGQCNYAIAIIVT